MGSFLFRLLRVFIVLGIAFGLALWLFMAREAPDKKAVEKVPPGVNVTPVHSQDHTMVVDAFGTVVPRTRVNLAAEVGGRIEYLHPSFREGGRIHTGDLLIRIDRRSFLLNRQGAAVRLEQARADIRNLTREIENLKADADLARTNMKLSLKELERVKALSKSQFASKANLDKAEQQYLAARRQLQSVENGLALSPSRMALKKAALAAAQNELAKADLVLEKSEIRAGFNGFVLSKQAEMGEFVNPGQVMGVVYEAGALDVDVGIPFEEIRWLRPVFEAGKMPDAEITIANLEGGVSPVWTARVARIKARVDEKTRTLPLTIEIGPIEIWRPENRDLGKSPLASLKPGTFVRCRISGETLADIFMLPRHLLRSENTLFAVRDNKLEIRRVDVIRKFEGHVFIRNGVSEGDQVVTSPLPVAREGMAVTIKTEAD
ncbi:MAG: efflux RND transporter periplasmic adaptor subunit [Desulfobacter sp.]|nr:MAG: efflux RND transporter periplasmic adaptor subunit [Desulfobacter sp.]